MDTDRRRDARRLAKAGHPLERKVRRNATALIPPSPLYFVLLPTEIPFVLDRCLEAHQVEDSRSRVEFQRHLPFICQRLEPDLRLAK